MPGSEKSSRWLRDGVTALGGAVFLAACVGLARADLETIGAVVVCLLLIALLGRLSLRMPRRGVVLSVSEPLVFGVLLFIGPLPAVFLAGLDGMISSARHTRRLRLRLANGAMMCLSIGIAGLVFETLAPAGFRADATHAESLATATMLACLAFFGVNSGLVSLGEAMTKGRRLFDAWRETTWTLLSYSFSAGTALLAWMFHARWGNLALAVGVPALAVVYFVVWTRFEKIAGQERHHAELQNLHQRTMEAFALAIDSRHPRARGHARRVQAYTDEIARRLIATTADPDIRQLGSAWLASLSAAALLHDIGKLGVPDQLLSKCLGELSEGELDRLRRHPAIGAAILGGIPFPFPLDRAIRHHHERWDGMGYPDELRGEEIPLAARLIGVADTLDHLHLNYVGPEARRTETMRLRMAEQAGRQLDPSLVEIYCDHAQDIERAVASLIQSEGTTQETSEETEALEDIDRAQKEAGVLYDLARQLGSTLDMQDTAVTVLHRLVELLPATSACLYVYDEQARMLIPQAAIGPLTDVLETRRFAPGEGTAGWCYQTGEPLLGADPRVDLGRQIPEGPHPVATQAVIPITDEGGTCGVISLFADRTRVFDADQLRVLDAVVPQIARALANARLYESTRTTSMTDALTSLPNSRFLYSQFDKELARATRKGMPLSVVVLDLDGFKPINDTYGHQAGDAVLRQVAVLLREAFRHEDIVCRYAGDEFVALLPETSPEEAARIVGRVQQTLSSTAIPIKAGSSEPTVKVGISAGWACFPLDGTSLEELVHRADKEMYRDKSRRYAESGATPR